MIDVLLATYNGAKHLPNLLESLGHQTFRDWRLVVRDDGSTDGSLAIVESWAQRQGVPLRVVRDGLTRLGASGNFGALLESSDAPYFMPCDQDDVWLPDKTARLLALVRQAEARLGTESPIVAHSDLTVVDADLRQMHQSFWRYQRLMKPLRPRLYERLVIQNVVTGCASVGNASLRSAALPIPREAMMHDWWLALVAAAFGDIVEEPGATVLYRQHGANALGAKSWSVPSALMRFARNPAASARRAHFILSGTQLQAKAFADRFGASLDPAALSFFRDYAALRNDTLWRRKAFPFKHHLWFDDFVRNCGLLLFI